MNFKDIGKGLKKLGKSKIAKEITEEVTDESLESITNGLLEKNKELLNSIGNQWKKEAIDTVGAMSHLPEIKPMPKGALRNKVKSVISKSPLRVIERTGKYRSGYDVVGMSADFDIEGVIKSKNARNYLIGSLDVGPFETRYLLGGKAKKTPENKLLGDRVSFNVNAQNYIDNGVEAPYWVRKRAGRANVKPKQEIKNRRKGNREIKEIPVNNSTHQEQQLLLDAPVQKEPRKPRREYKSDLGTNTEPIELSGPTKNRRRGNRSVKETPVNTSVQQSQQLLLEAPKQKGPRREYKSDLGINTEPIPLSGPVKSAPQSSLEQKNKKVDVSMDDFKSADELEQMNIEDDNEIDVTHFFEDSDSIKDSQLDKLEELRENGTLSQEEYEKAIDNVINDSNMNIETDTPIMSEPESTSESMPEINNNQPKKKQSRRQQRKEENLKNNHQQTSTQEQQLNNRKQMDIIDTVKNESEKAEKEVQKSQQQIFNEYAEQNFKPLKVGDNDLSAFKSGDGYDVTLRNARAENITFNDISYDVLYGENGARVFRDTQTGDFVRDQKLANSLNSIGESERNKYLANLSDDNWDLIAGNSEKGIVANPEKYGFNRAAAEGVEGYDARLMNEMDANEFRRAVADAKFKETQNTFEKEKDKKIRKQLEDKRNKLNIDALKAQKEASTKKIQLESRKLKKEAGNKFNEALGLDKFEKGSTEYYEALKAAKGTAAYEEAVKDLKKQMGDISKSKEFDIKSTNRSLDSQIKGWAGKKLTVKNAITVGFSAKAAVDKYKESRAEGKSAGSAAIRAGASAVAAEVLGPLGSTALMAAQVAPKIAAEGANALYTEYRRMNSASNFVPLGGVNFQDSQELATMRQSGMELAKMAQYNLEQSLMGAEAKHLHR